MTLQSTLQDMVTRIRKLETELDRFKRMPRGVLKLNYVNDVDATGVSGGDFLSWNSVTEQWEIMGSGRDAFGRLRVSNPAAIFSSDMQYDKNLAVWNEKITNGSGSAASAHQANESAVKLTVGSGVDEVIRQTKQFFNYQPGKSQLITMTFLPTPAETGLTQRYGYFHGNDGIFFEINETGPEIVVRTSTSGAAVDGGITQANWNRDKLDGTGTSGITLDFSKTQILFIEFQWLGVGAVRVGFNVDGVSYVAHEFDHANVLTTVYMKTANLPIRYEVSSDGTLVGTADVLQICCDVASEGGQDYLRGLPFSSSNGVTVDAVTTREPVLAIRPSLTFNSITNRISSFLESVSIYTKDQSVRYEIVYGGTLTGASFAAVNSGYSGMERDVSATAISGGIVIFEGYTAIGGIGQATASNFNAFSARVPIALDIDGAHPTTPLTDSISVVVTSIPGSSTDVLAAIQWREIR